MFSILDTEVPRHSDYWKLYTLLRRIVNIVSSFEIVKIDLDQMYLDICDFINKFKILFPNETVTYKMHHMTHYKDLILKLGPLILFSTLRFERLHQLAKGYLETSKNRKNVPFSIMNSYLLYLSSHDRNFDEEIELIFKEDIEKLIEENCIQFLALDKDVYVYSKTVLADIEIKLGCFYLYRCKGSNGYPIFVKIEEIFKQEDDMIVIGRKYIPSSFSSSDYCFELSEKELFKVEKIDYFKSLVYFKNNNKDFVQKNFYLPFNDCNYLFANNNY